MDQATANRQQIQDIKFRMRIGEITYAQAKAEAQPIIDSINAKSVELSKKYKMRPSKVSFTALMR